MKEVGPKPFKKVEILERHLHFVCTYEIAGLVKILCKILWDCSM